jgi:hypothetical protein
MTQRLKAAAADLRSIRDLVTSPTLIKSRLALAYTGAALVRTAGQGCTQREQVPGRAGWNVGEGAIVKDQVIVQSWQPLFMTIGAAAAALAGLVFVAMSLHPQPILGNPLMRARAFVAGTGFLMGVVWALIMLMPARLAPLANCLLIVAGIGGFMFVAYQQFQVRKAGLSVVRVVLGDILVLAPLLAGIVGLLQPYSEFPFVLLAIAAGGGLLLLFSQSWMLVMHSIINADNSPWQQPRSSTDPHSSQGE